MQNGYAVQEQQNNAAAVFGSATYEVTPDFKLRGGVRYTVDNKNFVAEQLQSPIGAPPTGQLYANPDDTDVSWDVSGTYKLTPTVSAYARVARGFRAPSVQGRLLFGSTLSVAKSETVLSYETGIKADLFNKRARIAFNVFRSEVEDQQLTAVGGGANFNTLLNADKALLQGAELDFKAILSKHVLMTLGASYNYTEIQDAGLAVAPCGSAQSCSTRSVGTACGFSAASRIAAWLGAGPQRVASQRATIGQWAKPCTGRISTITGLASAGWRKRISGVMHDRYDE